MEKLNVDLAVIGGGPAGMAAALSAYNEGLRNILIIERENSLGGILRQCIHNGFGLHRFGEELTGPEYAYRYEKLVKEYGIPYLLNATVVDVASDKCLSVLSGERGMITVNAKSIVLAMGCRERPKGALGIAGSRPAGIYTAGTAQKYVNLMGYMPGKEVVILGSGDIGLIMARRMTLEGAKVRCVCELMPYSGGLARNIRQCLDDFDIPLKLSHTVTRIHGKERVTGVTIAKVDEKRRPIPETEEFIPCDTLLLSCGLIPENELTKKLGIQLDRATNGAEVDEKRQTRVSGVFACGNVLHVHDLVDYVSGEAEIAGKGAAEYVRSLDVQTSQNDTVNADDNILTVLTDGKVRYTVPQRITALNDTTLYFRVADIFRDKSIVVRDGEKELLRKKKAKLAPGEMETLTLSKELLTAVSGDKLYIGLAD